MSCQCLGDNPKDQEGFLADPPVLMTAQESLSKITPSQPLSQIAHATTGNGV